VNDALVKNNFPLASNPVYSDQQLFLAASEYSRVDDMLQRKLQVMYQQPSISFQEIFMKYQQLSSMIIRREKPLREQLENLAIEIIRTIFSPPAHLNLKAMISSRLNMDVSPDDQKPSMMPDLSPERLKYLNEQVQRRIILNGLVQGSAMHIWKSSHYIVNEKLSQLSPALMPLYDEYISLTNFSLWQVPVSLVSQQLEEGQGFMTQGQCKLDFHSGKDVILEIKATNFPVMLHELTKGIVDYLICHAIPEDLTEEELDYYYAKADSYPNEIWHYFLSPSVWNSFVQAQGCRTDELPRRIYQLCQMGYPELVETFKGYIDEYRANNNS
jgi:hypothetical protein